MTRQPVPAWFRIVGVALIAWGVMGGYACVQQLRLGAEAMGPATEYDRALIASLPVWYNAVYIVAVGCGLFGAVALLARSVLSIPLFAISLIAVIVMFGWMFAATDILAVKGAGTLVFPLVIAAIAVFQLWLGRHARARGWIG